MPYSDSRATPISPSQFEWKIGLHWANKRKRKFPVITRESRCNSSKTTWFSRHRKMRPLPATASQGKAVNFFPVPFLQESCFPCCYCPLTHFACLSTGQKELLLSLPGPIRRLYSTALYIVLVSSVFSDLTLQKLPRGKAQEHPAFVSPFPSPSHFSLMLSS